MSTRAHYDGRWEVRHAFRTWSHPRFPDGGLEKARFSRDAGAGVVRGDTEPSAGCCRFTEARGLIAVLSGRGLLGLLNVRAAGSGTEPSRRAKSDCGGLGDSSRKLESAGERSRAPNCGAALVLRGVLACGGAECRELKMGGRAAGCKDFE
jgi:hypothetical protein